ncbi:glycosyltransferase family 4 protein [Ideonella sp. BN130291]|uniref:glycosyltransferase family 4 protein n=1 Tax=Ideonella sp. BN130291 TaxID=3112940 RepID=UPI002E26509C|nr:glycosyltransferase family 4 protein [Ideonella sp. BN130291]
MRVCLVKLGSLPVLAEAYKHERVGGEEVQHALLAKALARRGIDVRVVVGDYGQPAEAVYDGVPTIRSFREGAGLPVVRFIHPRWTRLWGALARADADVYYLSCAGMELGLAAMFCRLHNRRLVFRIASDSDCDPSRLLVRFKRDKWLYEYGLRHSDAVLAQSVLQQELLLRHYGVESVVAQMLVERPDVSADANRDIDVLWVANLRRVKRPDRLLTVARALPAYRFHMAGGEYPGELALYERIREEAARIPNLTFHGGVPYRDISHLFDRARLFANTSELEGFPNTFVQSWVRGIPIVATFDPDQVIARNGLGVSVADDAAMVGPIADLLENRASYDAARKAVLQYVERRHGEADVLAPYLACLAGPATPQEALS